MGIAYSKGPIHYSEFTPTSKTAMVSGLHAGATACGWSSTPVTGGYDYVLTSPQTDVAKLRVKVTESGVYDGINVECRSFDELRTGLSHLLLRGASDITVWMNQCQFFIATKGISYNAVGWTHTQVMGGIPWVAAVSTGETTDSGRDLGLYSPYHTTSPATESWWSVGGNSSNFRFTFNCAHSYVGCVNGVMRKHALGDPYPAEATMPQRAHLALMPITPTGRFGQLVPATLWNDDPFYLDPWICWGAPTEPANTIVQGQVWDAIQPSVERPLEEEITFDEMTWKNYLCKNASTDDNYGYYSYYISLYLLKSAPATGHGHYAY